MTTGAALLSRNPNHNPEPPNVMMPADAIRNVGIIAHIDAGKTTLTERILYDTGTIRYMGDVPDGNTVTDTLPQERQRGISIISAAVTCTWGQTRINVIDTPGHIDFTAEVERTLSVMDGAIAVFCALRGVQAQSETVWRQARRHAIPTIAFINKLDRPGADHLRAVRQIKERLLVNAVPLQFPVELGHSGCGLVDLLTGDLIGPDSRTTGERLDFASRPELQAAHSHLIECLAESDDVILNAYLEDDIPEPGVLRDALRRAVIRRNIVPVLYGSALRNFGVPQLLDAVCGYLPSAADRIGDGQAAAGELQATVFKVMDQDGPDGPAAFLRIYTGTLTLNCPIWNARGGDTFTPTRLWRVYADLFEPVDSAGPGEIVAASGAGTALMTGDTLATSPHPAVTNTSMSFPEPVVSTVVEAAAGTPADVFANALRRFSREDPTLKVKAGPLPGQWTIAGMGELHLDVVLDRIRTDFQIETRAGHGKVEYRDTIAAAARGTCHFAKKLANGEIIIRADLELEVTPLHNGAGLEVVLPPGSADWPETQREAIAAGIRDFINAETDGFPLTDMRIRIVAAEHDAGEAAALAFLTATRLALADAITSARRVKMEPVMRLEVSTPQDHLGAVIADLSARRARITEVDSLALGAARIAALVPLAELLGYASAIRSLSAGRADFVAEPAAYEPVSQDHHP
ncbi:MAG: GTP-binding protein [Lentisphaeria bacterium]|nr:GTP-binding protein [Lentisphaeria bacterium]